VKSGQALRLFMTADAVGGVWTYALDLARGLVPHQVATTLATLGPRPSTGQLAQAETIPGLELIPMDLPLDWTAASPEEVKAAGAALAALAEGIGPDIVHLHSAALGAQASFPAPLVASCHSCVATWWDAVRASSLPDDFVWRAALTLQGYRAADALIAPTAAFAEATRRTYGLDTAPHVVHNGRRTARHRPEPLPLASPFAFTAGRLWDEGKNIVALERAAARLRIPVVAAGPLEGPNGTRIELEQVRAVGPVRESEIAAWLSGAPIFVSPARYEPFGLAVLEAAQAGCALVLSDIPTFRELWDGAALFVPCDDDRALAAAIEHVIGDKDVRTRLGAEARIRSRLYSYEAMADGVAEIYRTLLPATNAAAREELVA
jgi:glycosyltransferase involved in cell wall biosynthesis